MVCGGFGIACLTP
ncbi:hypothetical protein L3V22_23090 [Vibrio parahaemolyticus]|nr:hypothetical protein [Vibrio parahaemolyticus]MCL1708048.1 hypothetical protein [Vibrio parahaemolyticus]MCL1712569.1 hypothetical protein [Vibrio parahaemolyticus]MCL1712599.1 hypothetical protein [Vibrio parahaemolyticus]MCL1717121.1 hypothetical protein [Vibrio parahaemolyticus]